MDRKVVPAKKITFKNGTTALMIPSNKVKEVKFFLLQFPDGGEKCVSETWLKKRIK